MESKGLFLICLLLIQSSFGVVQGIFTVDKRKAFVTVRNNSPDPVVGVAVIHKYSDVYTHRGIWDLIQPGELAGNLTEVEYNTGTFATGRDWWYITWFTPDMKKNYYSSPNNFRGIIDFAEKIGPDIAAVYSGIVSGVAAAIATGGKGIVLGPVVGTLVKKLTDPLFNSQSTVGFKQHILTRQDEGSVVEIIINENRSISIKSKSGTSNTVSTWKWAS